jgi:hypothetical protein
MEHQAEVISAGSIKHDEMARVFTTLADRLLGLERGVSQRPTRAEDDPDPAGGVAVGCATVQTSFAALGR